ncbi:MAG: aldo/keto reductase [Candidatus Nitrosopolaris sp.]
MQTYIQAGLAIEDMMRYHETGITTWDLADIYGPAEDFVGKFRLNHQQSLLTNVLILLGD